MLTPVGTAMLFRAFPPIERAKASTVLIIPTVLAPALGPIIGGWLVTDVSWRWIFYVNLPIGVIGFVLGALYPARAPRGHGRPLRPRRASCCPAPGSRSCCTRCREGPEKGWRSPAVIAHRHRSASSLFALLVVVETRVEPADARAAALRERMFRNANIVLTLTYGSFVGVLFLLPLFLQELRGLTALRVGAHDVPAGDRRDRLEPARRSPLPPRRAPPADLRRHARRGDRQTCCSWSSASTPTSGGSALIMFARGICMAFAFVPLQAATYANITPADTGRASAIVLDHPPGRRPRSGVAVLLTVLLSGRGSRPRLRVPRGVLRRRVPGGARRAHRLLIRDEDVGVDDGRSARRGRTRGRRRLSD